MGMEPVNGGGLEQAATQEAFAFILVAIVKDARTACCSTASRAPGTRSGGPALMGAAGFEPATSRV